MPPEQPSGWKKTPISRGDARLVRAANAVPTWQAVMPAKDIVVATR